MSLFRPAINQLEIYNFRNHKSFKYNLIEPKSVVITGLNGIGKTNILEAISLLTASKGLRGAKISELTNQNNPNYIWKIIAGAQTIYGLKEITTQRNIRPNHKTDSRIVEIDGQLIQKKDQLGELFNIVWLTPPMQQLFIGSSSDRRNFFDQIVSNFFTDHSANLSKYEKSTRERLKLLKNGHNDDYWLAAIEQNMFDAGSLVSDARMKTLVALDDAIERNHSPFIRAIITLDNEPIASDFLKLLKKNRSLDAASGRTNLGPHLFDLNVIYKDKNMPAKFCSTGEQKTLLLNIIFAQIQALIEKNKVIPILLFDEVISHFDADNRRLLFEQILDINAQTWFTGIDPKSFSQLEKSANFIHLE